jgi:molecular chaperone DnaK
MSVRCGIDLGTTYSAISYHDVDNRRVEPIQLEHADGQLIIPSVVYFEPGGTVVVGEAAQNAAVQYPDRVITGIKRSMREDFKTAPIDRRAYTPQEVSAEILKVLRADAEHCLDARLHYDLGIFVLELDQKDQDRAKQGRALLAEIL